MEKVRDAERRDERDRLAQADRLREHAGEACMRDHDDLVAGHDRCQGFESDSGDQRVELGPELVDHLQAGERGFAEWDHPGAQRVAQVGSTLHPATGLERQQDGLAGGAVEAGATGDVADAELDGRMRGEVRDHIDHTVGRS